MGGIQGGTGEWFGKPYDVGSYKDYIVEAFAGPHDFFNNPICYDAMGNIIFGLAAPKISYYVAETMNCVNVLLVSPLAISSVTPEYVLGSLFNKSEGK